MLDYQSISIGDVVADEFMASKVFHKYGIDFCCGGKKNLKETAETQNIPFDQLVQELEDIRNSDTNNFKFKEWTLELLNDYVLKFHHNWIKEEGPRIKELVDKVTMVHGKRVPSLNRVQTLFNDSLIVLGSHLNKEELVLFPYIYEIAKQKQIEGFLHAPAFRSVQNPVRMMMEEHDAEGERFREIEDLTNQYQPPKNACNSYRLMLVRLKEFQDNLHEHIHIENNIIFPRAIQFERELMEE